MSGLYLSDQPFEPSHLRCRHCGGLLLVDVGGGDRGEVTGEHRCPNCDAPPEAVDWLLLRQAVATVRQRSARAA